MRVYLQSLLTAAALLPSGGCKAVECGEGTIESGGECVPADEIVSAAKCGPFTKLVGDMCTPVHDPTVCGPGTVRDVDPATGIGSCQPSSGAGGGCGAPIACPTPTAAGKQTICGQLYDFETSERFEATGATGARCTAVTADGPCALSIRAFDAIAFASNPQTAMPLAVEDTYVDDCGRYRLQHITAPSNPFVGLGIDDAAAAGTGPAGITNIVGLATPRVPDSATRDFEAFIARKATTDAWAASGGPPLSGGVYAMVFRARSKGAALNPGVMATRSGATIPANDAYLGGCGSLRTAVDTAATATGGTGTALVTGASVNDSVVYSGTGGLPPECRYTVHAGASIPQILFVQVLRPTSNAGMTCPL
ncbi:MAG TPA: hypothetical protein VNO30_18180 [Kofleriaceae bacterium]|nr:hypothetical protein [Kofleriaceae bacterium]